MWDKDFLDMMELAYIAFDGKAGGEFAFGCVTGSPYRFPQFFHVLRMTHRL